MRPRTLPLALSGTLLGSFLAAYYEYFNWSIFILATITAVSLQLLSNVANDYGDGMKGTDGEERIGPVRATQSGVLSVKSMKTAIGILISVSFLSGLLLIITGTKEAGISYALLFVMLGIGAILSAVKYTVGSNSYGYIGLGDLFVFLWFGLVNVAGTFFLHTNFLDFDVFLPAASLGFLSVGVLNINNLRDRVSDKKAGKKTLVVRIGEVPAKIYQVTLITVAIALTGIFLFRNYFSFIQLLFLVTIPFFVINLNNVVRIKEPKLLDPYLKRLSISTLFFSVTLGLGLILSIYA